jgi:hypothetical protein
LGAPVTVAWARAHVAVAGAEMAVADSAAIKKHFVGYSLGWIVPRKRYVSVFVPGRDVYSSQALTRGIWAVDSQSEVVAVNGFYAVALPRMRRCAGRQDRTWELIEHARRPRPAPVRTATPARRPCPLWSVCAATGRAE